MDKSYDIFISYSRKDSEQVLSIAKKLTEEGYSVWIDTTGIESGDEFKSVIAEAIKKSKVFVFFSSFAANKSPWTVKEVNTAVHLNKTIIPVKLDNTEYNESLLLDLSGLDFINYRDNPNFGLQKLLRSLRKHLSNASQGLQNYNIDLNSYGKSTSASQGSNTKNYLIAAVVLAALIICYLVFNNKDDNKEIAAAHTEQAVVDENSTSSTESTGQTEQTDDSKAQAPVVIVKEVKKEIEPRRESSNQEIVTTASATSSGPAQTTSPQTVSKQAAAPSSTMSDDELLALGKKAMRSMDYTTAKKSFSQAASHGSIEGNYQLGMLYCNSNYDGYNRETAASYFVKAASSNHVDAMYQAGMMYLGIDNSTAKLWLERAAAAGHSKAETQLSKIK